MQKYEEYAQRLREAMKGGGTDEDTIIQITGSTKNSDRLNIRQAYKAAFGRDLIEDVEDDLTGDFKKVVIGMYRSPVEYDVTEIYEAFNGAGTDEDTLTEIIGSRSNYRLKEIKKLYKEKYGEDLESRISSEASADYKKLLTSILQCNRDESNNVDNSSVEKDVKALYDAGEGKWGTDEEVFNRIFALRNSLYLKALDQAYAKKSGKRLIDVVESEFSGDVKVLLKTILHAHVNPADYYAQRIYKACKGWGTNDSMLIRAFVTMDEIYMEEIKKIYQKKYGTSIYDQVKDEISGDYQRMILALVNN